MSEEVVVDSDRFSRQQAAYGLDAMKKMLSSSILVCGLRGLGAEIVKDIALAGVQRLMIHDEKAVGIQDLGANFFYTKGDVGKNRADCCSPRLSQLNGAVNVTVVHGDIDETLLARCTAVILTEATWKEQERIGNLCHKLGVKFVCADACGLFAQVFVDFGDEHVVFDTNGEEPRTALVSFITQDEDPERPSVVSTVEDNRHGFMTGDFVRFVEVKGMDALNELEAQEIKVVSPYAFSIKNTSKLGRYVSGGIAMQVKQPKTFSFKPIGESLKDPEFFVVDFAKMDRPSKMHSSFQALHSFREAKGRYPAPGCFGDAEELFEIAQQLNTEVDKKILTWFSLGASAEISPMCAFVGGVVAQEAFKGVTGKYTPIKQWMYFDAVEALPLEPLASSEYEPGPSSSRYDDQIALFGKTFQEKILNGRSFMVGAGAIGCEVLKNWAMMGWGCGLKGHVDVTDMDIIETSNLSRQFLFRSWDVGKLKSEVASRASKAMNPDLNVTHLALRVGKDTENVLNDEFFGRLDLVCNALDNLDARLYMDSRCVYHRKPLLESGTLGTKGNTQVIFPGLTQSFASTSDPPEESIPICTLSNFPNKIAHTIQWGRDLFEGVFHNEPEALNSYLSKPDFVESQRRMPLQLLESVQAARRCLDSRSGSFDDAIVWARQTFQSLFHDKIAQLLFNFPLDMVRSTGEPFWSGAKRPPNIVDFDPENDLHVDFIVAAAMLKAELYGVKGKNDRDYIRKVASAVKVDPFVPKQNVVIKEDEDEGSDSRDEVTDDVEAVLKELPAPAALTDFRVNPLSFEKDDDTNFHIDFITAASNLRAVNYKIEPADRFHTKIISGKIIPALITTTAVVCGLVCIEHYKYLRENVQIEDLKCAFLNLALPYIDFTEPAPAEKHDMTGMKWTIWDRIDYDRDLTIGELIDDFKEKYNVTLSIIAAGKALLYNEYMYVMNPGKKAERLSMKLSEISESLLKDDLRPGEKYVTLSVAPDEDDVDVAPIRVRIRS